MIFRCPLCNESFEFNEAYFGKRVECPCGNKWDFPKDLDSLMAQELKIDISLVQPAVKPPKWKSAFDCETESELDLLEKEIKSFATNQYEQAMNVDKIKRTLSPTEAYQKIKPIVFFESPVPGVFNRFIKICRELNREDKKSGNIKTVVMRVKLMKKIAQKHIDVIWNNMSQGGPVRHTTKQAIKEHYWLITVTDEKNSKLLSK